MYIYEYQKDMGKIAQSADFIDYLLFDVRLNGTRHGLENAIKYIHQSFLLNNPHWKEVFAHIGARELSMMERLAQVIHQMHGSDARYLDESNDDTPAHELHDAKQEKVIFDLKPLQDHYNDFTAVLIKDIEDERYLLSIYNELYEKLNDASAKEMVEEMKELRKQNIETLSNILEILTEHDECKDFGLGDSHNAWSYDSGNYFDKLNPKFVSIEDVPKLKEIQKK